MKEIKNKEAFIREGDVVVYKSFWGKKIRIVNRVFKNEALIGDYFWNANDNKILYCKLVKLEKLYK